MKRVATALPKASKEELEAAFAASMMEYQAYNTALYDAIDPSVLLNGAYETVDRLQRKEFANGDLRDGVGLYNYVRDLTRRDPIEQQIEAMRALATHGVLSADKNVTQVQFDRHVNGLLTKWTDVNLDAANVADFRNRLIASLPDEPLTSKVVLIRIYLVDACNANKEETKTVQGLVRLVTKRGRELGLPAGSVLDEIVAPVIEKDKRDKKDGGKTQDQKPGDASNLNVKSTRRPRAGENEDHGGWSMDGIGVRWKSLVKIGEFRNGKNSRAVQVGRSTRDAGVDECSTSSIQEYASASHGNSHTVRAASSSRSSD